ncbi:MAG: helix-turn-helix domain-containing protein [Terracidiphilus sp.]
MGALGCTSRTEHGQLPRKQVAVRPGARRSSGEPDFLGVSVSTLQGWRSRGTGGGPSWTKVGGMVMYSMKELERFMEERTAGRQ